MDRAALIKRDRKTASLSILTTSVAINHFMSEGTQVTRKSYVHLTIRISCGRGREHCNGGDRQLHADVIPRL